MVLRVPTPNTEMVVANPVYKMVFLNPNKKARIEIVDVGVYRLPEKVKVYTTTPESALPTNAHGDDIGFDLRSTTNATIYGRPLGWRGLVRFILSFFKKFPNRVVIQTGFKAQPQAGFGVFVCSRSGLAAKNSVFIANAPGIIDGNYQGDISCILVNVGEQDLQIKVGDRIGQVIFLKYAIPDFVLIKDFQESNRGEQGFGSTGV